MKEGKSKFEKNSPSSTKPVRKIEKKDDRIEEVNVKIVCLNGKRASFALCLVALGVALVIALVFIGSYAVGAFAKKRKLPIYSVDRTDKKVAISFDCAWGVEFTDGILTELSRHGVKCTFFAVEFWVEKHPDYAKKIVEAGHELGTHSKTHPYMSKLTKEKAREELVSSSLAIEKTTGVKPTLFRPPFGDYDDKLIELCAELKLYPVQWDVDSLDWKNLNCEEMLERIIPKTQSGDILLFHNDTAHTAESLDRILSGLSEKGFTFSKVSDLSGSSGSARMMSARP